MHAVTQHITTRRTSRSWPLRRIRIRRHHPELRLARRKPSFPWQRRSTSSLQALDELLQRISRSIGSKRGDLLCRRRVAENVERHAADQLLAVGGRCGHRCFIPHAPRNARHPQVIGTRPTASPGIHAVRKRDGFPLLRLNDGSNGSCAVLVFVFARTNR